MKNWRLISRQIQESDYYVAIIAHRYGSTLGSLSYTEKEYDFAVEQKVPTLGFLIADSAPWPHERVETSAAEELKQFRAKVKSKPVAFWTSAEDLYGKVAISLSKQFTATPRPGWVRATEMIDPQVINELSRLSEQNRHLREELERRETADESEKKLALKDEHLDVIKFFISADGGFGNIEELARTLGWRKVVVQYYVDQLRDSQFLGSSTNLYGEKSYYLARQGRDFAVENGLVRFP
jgi:hypothetical protein